MQSVPIAWPVAEQQRRRARLAAVVALPEPFLEFVAPRCGSAAALGPVASDRQQVRPEGAPQAGNDIRNGSREVPILALAEPIARHDRHAARFAPRTQPPTPSRPGIAEVSGSVRLRAAIPGGPRFGLLTILQETIGLSGSSFLRSTDDAKCLRKCSPTARMPASDPAWKSPRPNDSSIS